MLCLLHACTSFRHKLIGNRFSFARAVPKRTYSSSTVSKSAGSTISNTSQSSE
jgi:hypothetical protein